jgi:hypothetical protein
MDLTPPRSPALLIPKGGRDAQRMDLIANLRELRNRLVLLAEWDRQLIARAAASTTPRPPLMAMAETRVPVLEDANAPASPDPGALGHLHASFGHYVAALLLNIDSIPNNK